MSVQASGWPAIRKVFSNRNYAVYTSGNSFSLIGLWVQRLAVGWLAWDLTKSGFWLGAVAFADLFPIFIVGPFGGVIADWFDRRKVSLICQSLSLCQASTLFFLTANGIINIGLLFTLSLFQGIIVSFHQPTRLSLVRDLVPAEEITTAVAINSVSFNLARFIGPAIAGLVITRFGVATAFAVNAISFISMIIALIIIRLPPQRKQTQKKNILFEASAGIRYAASHRAVGRIIFLMLVMALLTRPVSDLLPGFADAVFSKGAEGLAIFTSAIGFGAIAGGIWIAQRGSNKGLPKIAMSSVIISGLMVSLFSYTTHFWLAAASMAVAGVSMVTCGVATQTMIQSAVEEQMRGRILSLWGMIFRGGPAIGALCLGWLSGFYGLSWPLGAAGGLSVCIVLLMLAFPISIHEQDQF
ncbi:MAG: MFS transporter [SAR324 cluster bacterium]|nr:MFS transporter [SAR324 cluster bacterium]